MTQDEIIEMARQVARQPERIYAPDEKEFLYYFANLVAAKEREALAQTEQKQDGECKYCTDGCPACDATKLPPQRTWVGLTDEEVDECYYWKDRQWTTDELVRHVEAKLKERNS